MPKFWTEDNGELWYQSPAMPHRERGRRATCEVCGEQFPALNRNAGRFCSATCRGRIVGRTANPVRAGLFEHWTPEECWLAGLLWADGHLAIDGSYRRVMLNLTDEEAIAGAATVIGCQYRTYAPHASSKGRKPVHRLQFGDQVAVAHLAAIGFDEPKLTTRPWPELPYPASFLRGMFDADGSVLLHQQGGRKKSPFAPLRLYSKVYGSVPCLAGLQDFLAGYGITPKKPVRVGSTWIVGWNHRDSLGLARVMYAESGPHLRRKREIFERA